MLCFKEVVLAVGRYRERQHDGGGRSRTDRLREHAQQHPYFSCLRRRRMILIMYVTAAQRRCWCFHLYYHYFSVWHHFRRGPRCIGPPGKARTGHNILQSFTNNICWNGSQANPPPPLCLVLRPSPPTFALIYSSHQPVLPSPPVPFLSVLFFFPCRLQEEPSFTGTVDLAQALAHPAKWVLLTAAKPSWLQR